MSKRLSSILIISILIFSVVPLTFVEFTEATGLDGEVSLSMSGDGVAEWSNETACDGSWSIHLKAPDTASWNSEDERGEGVNEGRINITLPSGTTLGDIESISWCVNTTSGYPPHVDLLLDLDGDGFNGSKKDIVTGESLEGNDDVLVAEFAYQPYDDTGYDYSSPGIPYGHYAPEWQSSFYYPLYDTWVQTFQNATDETGTTQVDNDTVFWLYSGLPGPYSGGYFGILADFKDGTVQVLGDSDLAMVDNDTVVFGLQIEVDNWLGPAEAYIDDISLNGEALVSEPMPPEIDVEKPEDTSYAPGAIPVNISTSDPLGVDEVWFNVKNDTGEWVYPENRTYTSPTDMPDFTVGTYQFYAWANNTLGLVGENSTIHFTVVLPGVIVDINPNTLNLKSHGRWITVRITLPEGYDVDEIDISSVRLEYGGESVSADWGNAGDSKLMVKFSRSAVAEILDIGDEVEITVTGELDGTPFEDSDTIRVIKPGNAGENTHLSGNDGENVDNDGDSFGKGQGNKGGLGKGHGKNNKDGKGKGK